jgi:anaerobic selenocysteine-containing dehydrogenase
LISELKLVAEIAKASLEPNRRVAWDNWMGDYSRIRAAIGETCPDIFHDYDRRMWEPGGFHRSLPARDRIWNTKTEKANFITPRGLDEDKGVPEVGHEVLRMITLRSNDQFNTTIYGYDDRFRGIHGTRMVVLMNRNDVDRLGLKEGETVSLRTSSTDNVERVMSGFRVTPYNIPNGCIGTYYPKANALLPVWHYAEGSKTPAAK